MHYLSKNVAGVPLRRPAWWFDVSVAGEAIADVGTHLADLAMWLGFPEQAIDYRKDIEIVSDMRWPTMVDRNSFGEITGLADYPTELANLRDGEQLIYCGNGSVVYRLRRRYVRLATRWGVRAEGPEGDTHLAIARGSRSSVSVLHEAALGVRPQVIVTPLSAADRSRVRSAIECHCQNRVGYEARDLGDRIHVIVPESERMGHESHFASVLREFVTYFHDRSSIPTWERPNSLAKYLVTTRAVQ
jgi:hypothetical protein